MGTPSNATAIPGPAAPTDAYRTALTRLRAAVGSRRSPIVLATHLALSALAGFLAIWLRFDGNIPEQLLAAFVTTLPWVLAVRLMTFLPFGLFGGLWRYTGIWDLSRIVLAVLTSSAIIYLFVHRELSPGTFPRSIIVIETLLLISFLSGVRLLWRIVPAARRVARDRRVLILGAGDAGEMIVREMRKGGGYTPVGFIDRDPGKVGRTIHGVTVLGTPEDLPRVVASTRPGEALVAIPSADAAVMRNIVAALEPFKLRITTLPSLRQLVDGKVGIRQIRPLAVEDLLPRSPVALSTGDTRPLIAGRRVLVTGAGGSIGSELCRQIAALKPARLVLYERYENSLFAVANDLLDRKLGVPIHAIIGDVTDAGRVDEVMTEHRPHVVFHAAAHKHVPLMEANPCEAVKNNVAGTHIVAKAAKRHGAGRFVLVSTDKAANPSSIMGATKRVAELIVQALSDDAATRFVTVRFGNVLGSNGSVIPRMLDQIRSGGPVTVTHPDITRYFMLIPEAVQLVLRAALLANNRDTFVLDMGEQVRVLDLARNLIRLSGFVPDKEIPITFIGLRPGEKLTEELIGEGEHLEPADRDRIFRVRAPNQPDTEDLLDRVAALVEVADQGWSHEIVGHLREIVPTFRPLGSSDDQAEPSWPQGPGSPRQRRSRRSPSMAPATLSSPG